MGKDWEKRSAGAILFGGIGYLASKLYGEFTRSRTESSIMDHYRNQLDVPIDCLQEIRADISRQMELGLDKKPGGLMMLPSFVDMLPSGEEHGDVYAIDLGGTNLRVLHARLSRTKKGAVEDQSMQEWPIPTECFNTDTGELLRWVVRCTQEVIKKHPPPKGVTPVIGFCFSFACDQTALDNGKLLLWTKNFKGRGLIGEDVVAALVAEFKAAGTTVCIPAILNDTVATICAALYNNPATCAGIILGTGTNCAYIERVDRLSKGKKLPAGYKAHGEFMVVNTEWGDARSKALPVLEEDVWVDCASANPGFGIFEKAISGLYMGEVARRLILRLATDAELFGEDVPYLLTQQQTFDSAALSAIDTDESPDLKETQRQLKRSFGIRNPSRHQLEVVKEVCWLVSLRSAKLCAAAIAAVLDHSPDAKKLAGSGEERVLAVDGSVFTKYPGYRVVVRQQLELLIGKVEAEKVKLELAHDASVLGAAVVAATAMRIREGGQ